MSSPNTPIPNGYLLGGDTPGIHTGSGEDIREREVPTSALRRVKQRRSESFLRGPIPIQLIGAVLELPRRPLPVLLAICHRTAITGQPWVTLPERVMAEFKFDRKVKSRALAEMERAGLIQVKRTPGRPVLVSLAGGPAAHSASGPVHEHGEQIRR
jgi:hypothetical protein